MNITVTTSVSWGRAMNHFTNAPARMPVTRVSRAR